MFHNTYITLKFNFTGIIRNFMKFYNVEFDKYFDKIIAYYTAVINCCKTYIEITTILISNFRHLLISSI